MGQAEAVVVSLVSQTEPIVGNVSYAANGIRAVSGLQAFNQYDWMTDTRTLNAAGNFRGMVVSTRWATTYNVVSKTGNVIGTVATVASIASNAIQLAPQFEAIYHSKESAGVKSLEYTSLAGTVAQRTLAGIITGGVHLIYMPLIAGCNLAASSGKDGSLTSAAFVCSTVLTNADALVQNSAMYVTDPTNQRAVLQRIMNIFIK